MWVILLEAFGAMALLLLIVWWTMFHGRRHGERHAAEHPVAEGYAAERDPADR